MIEQHDHVDLSMLALVHRDLRALDESVETAERTGKVVESG